LIQSRGSRGKREGGKKGRMEGGKEGRRETPLLITLKT
jgi:hypothetical protein